jgi:hypothetical protein
MLIEIAPGKPGVVVTLPEAAGWQQEVEPAGAGRCQR